jgi:predicted ATPase
VLDNCEQVIDAVARWAADALGAVSSLRVLTTSRTPLTIAAEAVYPLAALSSEADDPDSVGPAAQLFLDRARAVRPDAVLPIEVVVRLCDRLDGLPLAIELAAARVRSMTPEQIEARLRDRFALLTTGDRAAPERHRTLEAVIEWSWDLVDGEARGALATLSLLPAGFTAPTAAAVLGIPFAEDLLDRLVSQSLLIVADDPETGALRFRMLETVREFGQSRLVPDDVEREAWSAVLRWAREYATERVDHVLEPAVYRELHSEHDNLLSVLRYAIDHERAADAVAIAAVLGQAWIVRGSFSELLTLAPAVLRLETIAALDDVSPDARVVTLILGVIATQALGGHGITRSVARLRITLRRGGLSDRWAAFRPGDHRECRHGAIRRRGRGASCIGKARDRAHGRTRRRSVRRERRRRRDGDGRRTSSVGARRRGR